MARMVAHEAAANRRRGHRERVLCELIMTDTPPKTVNPVRADSRLDLPAIGVDFGERRIGLAISDTEGLLALPLETVVRDTDRRARYRIADIARRMGAASLVVGEPRLLDGQPSPHIARIRRFAERLARLVELPLYWVEETLTTNEADARLLAAGQRPFQGDPRRDMLAAQILLEDALAGGGRRHQPATERV